VKKVVLIGDSIRMGYQPFVRDELDGQAEVWGPQENGAHSVNVIMHLHEWVGKQQPDIVHVNAGLHDLKTDRWDGRGAIVPLAHYRENVARILTWVREQSGATAIWATTTPVNHELAHAAHAAARDFSRYNEDVIAFNEAAAEVAGGMRVPVNDLYAVIEAGGQTALQTDDGVHFVSDGYAALGKAVAEFLRPML
jgi:lysophospholipase L1-like esterase